MMAKFISKICTQSGYPTASAVRVARTMRNRNVFTGWCNWSFFLV